MATSFTSAGTLVETRTRDAIVKAILQHGPATAKDLAERLELTPAGIRRHLELLVNDEILIEREPYAIAGSAKHRGRPSKVFVMSDKGRENFEHSYDDLAIASLTFMQKNGGSNLIRQFAKVRADDLLRRFKKSKEEISTPDGLARALTETGFLSSVNQRSHGIELCQRHCPVAHVAAQFPELCEEETALFSQLLGTHVQRLATIAHGDGVCTTFIPLTATQSATPSVSSKSTSNSPSKKLTPKKSHPATTNSKGHK